MPKEKDCAQNHFEVCLHVGEFHVRDDNRSTKCNTDTQRSLGVCVAVSVPAPTPRRQSNHSACRNESLSLRSGDPLDPDIITKFTVERTSWSTLLFANVCWLSLSDLELVDQLLELIRHIGNILDGGPDLLDRC